MDFWPNMVPMRQKSHIVSVEPFMKQTVIDSGLDGRSPRSSIQEVSVWTERKIIRSHTDSFGHLELQFIEQNRKTFDDVRSALESCQLRVWWWKKTNNDFCLPEFWWSMKTRKLSFESSSMNWELSI